MLIPLAPMIADVPVGRVAVVELGAASCPTWSAVSFSMA